MLGWPQPGIQGFTPRPLMLPRFGGFGVKRARNTSSAESRRSRWTRSASEFWSCESEGHPSKKCQVGLDSGQPEMIRMSISCASDNLGLDLAHWASTRDPEALERVLAAAPEPAYLQAIRLLGRAADAKDAAGTKGTHHLVSALPKQGGVSPLRPAVSRSVKNRVGNSMPSPMKSAVNSPWDGLLSSFHLSAISHQSCGPSNRGEGQKFESDSGVGCG